MKFSQASMRPPGESAFHVIVLRVSGCSSLRDCSRAPATSTAASTASGGKALVSTPAEIRFGSHPARDSPSEPS